MYRIEIGSSISVVLFGRVLALSKKKEFESQVYCFKDMMKIVK